MLLFDDVGGEGMTSIGNVGEEEEGRRSAKLLLYCHMLFFYDVGGEVR